MPKSLWLPWSRDGAPNGDPFQLNEDSPQADGLIGWWPTLGTRGSKHIRNYCNAGASEATWIGGTSDPVWINDGREGWVLSLDGTNDYYQLTIPASLTEWSLLWRVYPSGSGFEHLIEGTGFQNLLNDTTWYLNWSGISSSVAVTLNAWNYMAMACKSGSTLGFQQGVQTVTSASSLTLSTAIRIGSYGQAPPQEYLTGRWGDLRLYKKQVSKDIIWQAFDPATRWDLYRSARRVYSLPPPSGNNYTETGLAQTLLFTQSVVDTAQRSELSKAQAVLILHGESDVATFEDTGKSQSVLLTQNETDAAAFSETGKSQTVLFGTSETDVAAFVNTGLAQTVLFTQGGSDSLTGGASYDETGKSQTILFSQTSTDARAGTETVAQTVLFGQGRTDNAAFSDTAKAQTLLFSLGRTDVGAFVDTGKNQTALFNQSVIDTRQSVETGQAQSLLFQSNRQSETWLGTEAVGQTILFTHASTSIAGYSNTGLSQVILFTQGGLDTVPHTYGTFVATASVTGRRADRSGVTIRGGI